MDLNKNNSMTKKEKIIELYIDGLYNDEPPNVFADKILFLFGVDSTFAIEFAQYIAEKHFRLVNVQNSTYYWEDETSLRTTEQLLEHFKNTRQ